MARDASIILQNPGVFYLSEQHVVAIYLYSIRLLLLTVDKQFMYNADAT